MLKSTSNHFKGITVSLLILVYHSKLLKIVWQLKTECKLCCKYLQSICTRKSEEKVKATCTDVAQDLSVCGA